MQTAHNAFIDFSNKSISTLLLLIISIRTIWISFLPSADLNDSFSDAVYWIKSQTSDFNFVEFPSNAFLNDCSACKSFKSDLTLAIIIL